MLRSVRRERVSTLRRMSDVAAGLQAEENAVVPPVVSRLLHLELELDRALSKQHAETLAGQKMQERIGSLRKKRRAHEHRMAVGQRESAEVAQEVEARGEALATVRAQHRHPLSSSRAVTQPFRWA